MAFRVESDTEGLWKTDIQTAKELFYPPEVIAKLEKEPRASKRQLILTSARKALIEKDMQ